MERKAENKTEAAVVDGFIGTVCKTLVCHNQKKDCMKALDPKSRTPHPKP